MGEHPDPADIARAGLLCRVCLAIASSRGADLEPALRHCADSARVRSWEVEEAILQGIPYSGFPGAVEGLGVWRRIDAGDGEPGPAVATGDREGGIEIFRRVYGEIAERVRGELRHRHPELERWILEFAYGRVMGRGALSLMDLEALGVASLIGQRRRAPLHSHLRGALRAGWRRQELAELLDRLAPDADPEIIAFARGVLARSRSAP